jgi:lipopolysaccharide cholinephosphotransferase
MTMLSLSEADLRRLHQVQLAMLLELDRVCRHLGVAYQLGAGTLLGAVRHGGFIPWDDDVDVVMLRADYQRFLREAPTLLDSSLFLQSWRSDPHFRAGFAKLRRHDSAFREELSQNSRHHHGIYIDIFPFDPVYPGCRWWRALLFLVLAIRRPVKVFQRLATDDKGGQLAPWRPAWQRRLGPLLHRRLALLPPSWWMAIDEGLMRCLTLVPSSQVVCLVSSSLLWQQLQALARPATEFEQTVQVSFEGRLLPVTANHHQALRRLYGDYMRLPPPEARMPTHPVVEFRLPEDGGVL